MEDRQFVRNIYRDEEKEGRIYIATFSKASSRPPVECGADASAILEYMYSDVIYTRIAS